MPCALHDDHPKMSPTLSRSCLCCLPFSAVDLSCLHPLCSSTSTLAGAAPVALAGDLVHRPLRANWTSSIACSGSWPVSVTSCLILAPSAPSQGLHPRGSRGHRPLRSTPSREGRQQLTVKSWVMRERLRGPHTTLQRTARQRPVATPSRIAPAGVSLLPIQASDGASFTGCPATVLHTRTLVVCGVPPSHPHRCGIRLLAPNVPGLPFPGGHCGRLLRHTFPLRVAVQRVSIEPAQVRRRPHRPLPSLAALPATWISAVPRKRSLGVEPARTTRRAAPPMSSYPYRSTMTRLS